MPRRSQSFLDHVALSRLVKAQDGVVARRQLLACRASRADVRRLLDRGELNPLHPGVYLDHNGPPTRRQRQWAAVLACAPAALHRESALEAHGMTQDRPASLRRDQQTIHLLVDQGRRLSPPAGVTVERVADHLSWVHENRRPPRAKFDYALLKAAADRTEAEAVALISDAVHQGLTTAERSAEVLQMLPRLPQRATLGEVLADVAAGTRSVLERRYLRQVERAHGLPHGERQLREMTALGVVLRDIRYRAQRTLVELDGAFGHRDTQDRWADLQRDMDAALTDHLTLRPGWAQVLEPCRLAALVGAVLRQRGWTGVARPCGPDCTVVNGGGMGRT